jgi:hypothetical protein
LSSAVAGRFCATQLLGHVGCNEVIALEDVAKGAAHVLKQLGKLHRRDRFQVRRVTGAFKAEKDIAAMVGKECIGVEKIWSAEWIEQGLLLGGGDFDFLAAPAVHGLDTAPHVIPARRHPLLVFLKRFAPSTSRFNAGSDGFGEMPARICAIAVARRLKSPTSARTEIEAPKVRRNSGTAAKARPEHFDDTWKSLKFI